MDQPSLILPSVTLGQKLSQAQNLHYGYRLRTGKLASFAPKCYDCLMDSISYRMNIALDPADIIRVFRNPVRHWICW